LDLGEQDRRQSQELITAATTGTRLRPRFFILPACIWYKAATFVREPVAPAFVEIPLQPYKVLSMSERPEEPNQASDAESLLPIDEHIEEGHDAEGRKVRHRGIYLLPNLFTTANLFAGFYSIINSISAQSAGNAAEASKYFAYAAIAIFVAMILDSLDGRVARMTNTQSAFGAEYDSLSDMVAFGVAPALLAFGWALGDMGKVGWMVAFIYVAGAALRLARFNTQVGVADKRYFIGLASPAAAGVVAGTVWAFSDYGIQGSKMSFLVALLVAAAGMLMVSNIKYNSFKELDLKGRVPFVAILAVVLVFAVVFSDPPRILLLIFLAYAASGPVQYLLRMRRHKQVG
jgi:CDP-diacylglycerol--serine O-phosphatidyltransferase